MQRVRSTGFASLSFRDQLKALRYARRWVKQAGDRNIIGVELGTKVSGGRRRPNSLVIRFLVRKKKKPGRKAWRIPKEMHVKVRDQASGRYIQIAAPTDVVESNVPTPTGGEVLSLGNAICTAGLVVRWKNGGKWSWALLTVSHPFKNAAISTTFTIRLKAGVEVLGKLLFRSKMTERIDCAIFGLDEEKLRATNLFNLDSASPIAIRSFSAFGGDATAHRPGTSQPAEGPLAFQADGVRCQLPLDDGSTRGWVLAGLAASLSKPFRIGRSGSAWTVAGELAAMQIAGLPSAYTTGYGQSTEKLLAWAKGKIGTNTECVFAF